LEQIDYFLTDDKKAIMCLKISRNYHLMGSKRYATEYYQKAIDYAEDETLKKAINLFYNEELKKMAVIN
jgi:hypothetical protein